MVCERELFPTNEDVGDIPVNMSWLDGNVSVMHCGYGSRYDLSNIIIALCDDCIEKNLHDGKIAVLSYE